MRPEKQIDCSKHGLEYESLHVIENWDKILYIHENKVNNIAEFNSILYIINPPKLTKHIIAVNISLYMDVSILKEVESSLGTSGLYWIVDLVPIL